MTRMQARMLPDGRRLHLNDGPIDLIVSAEGDAADVGLAYAAVHARALRAAACALQQHFL